MDELEKNIDKSVKDVLKLYKTYGHLHYGEGVTQLQHALQAAELAINEQGEDEMIVAAFLHDIGHLLSEQYVKTKKTDYGSVEHEYNGADYLEDMGFSDYVIDLVENHVLAKRYLVSSQSSYYDTLSEASKKTLEYQGGKMTIEEQEKFESNPYFEDYLTLRKYDDEAKEDRISPIKLEFMKGLLKSHLKNNLI